MASALRPALARHALQRRVLSSTLPAFRSQLLPRQPAVQRAAFQTTPIRAILPPLPQRIDGTVNDPVKTPEPEPSHGSYHWTAERLVSVAILPMTIAPFAAGALNPMMDGLLIGLTLVHSHIGFEFVSLLIHRYRGSLTDILTSSVITDYAPKWRVPKARKLLDWARNLALVVVGWGWYEFETNDVGLTEGIKRIWKA